jgi:steroid 5-alpha-reductase/3-oxo-5-alpha-steroid 4-dehydrogenase 1
VTDLYHLLLFLYLAMSAVTLPGLLLFTAPYGRHGRAGWGPSLSATAGWVLMESPAVVVFAVAFLLAPHAGPVEWLFLLIWESHYVQRTFIFPFRFPSGGKPMPILVAATGFSFNVMNGWLNGNYLTGYPISWLWDPRFLVGVALFAGGYAINRQSDRILFSLRKPGESGYKIPQGGLYEWISCPNYFGEMVEWSGWALATWSLPGLAFALWTTANLLPRAIAHHRWYHEKFADYPKRRKALIPGVL